MERDEDEAVSEAMQDILFKQARVGYVQLSELMTELDKQGFWDKVYVHTHSDDGIKTKCMACVFEKFAGNPKVQKV